MTVEDVTAFYSTTLLTTFAYIELFSLTQADAISWLVLRNWEGDRKPRYMVNFYIESLSQGHFFQVECSLQNVLLSESDTFGIVDQVLVCTWRDKDRINKLRKAIRASLKRVQSKKTPE